MVGDLGREVVRVYGGRWLRSCGDFCGGRGETLHVFTVFGRALIP